MHAQAAYHLIEANAAFLLQAKRLLSALSDDEYARRDPETGRGRIGAHLRHVLDHYDSLLAGAQSGVVDYDARRRDEALETSRTRAAARIDEVLAALRRLDRAACASPLAVHMDCAAGGARVPHGSTLGRELQFLASHTVHHYAVIGLVMASRGLVVDRDFGVAPSTLEHEAEQAACAR